MALYFETGYFREKIPAIVKDRWKSTLAEFGVGVTAGMIVKGGLRWGCEGALQCTTASNPLLAACIGGAGGAAVAASREYFIRQRSQTEFDRSTETGLKRVLKDELNYLKAVDKKAIAQSTLKGAAFGALGGLTGPLIGELIASNTDKFGLLTAAAAGLKDRIGGVAENLVRTFPVTEAHAAETTLPKIAAVETPSVPTPIPTIESTPTPEPTATPTPTLTPTVTPTQTLTPTAIFTASPTPTLEPTPTAIPEPSPTPKPLANPEQRQVLSMFRGALSFYEVDENRLVDLQAVSYEAPYEAPVIDAPLLADTAPVTEPQLASPAITAPNEVAPAESAAPLIQPAETPPVVTVIQPPEPLEIVSKPPEEIIFPKILSFEERLIQQPIEIELNPGSSTWEAAKDYLRESLGREPTPQEIAAVAKELCRQSGVRVDDWGIKSGVDHRNLRAGHKLIFNQAVKDSIRKIAA